MKNKLILFFTLGTSLDDWNKNGSIDREINIYKKLLIYFDEIYFLTYGKNDRKYSYMLPENIKILPKKISVNNFLYSLLIPYLYKKEIKESNWLKTNQMIGGWSAIISKYVFNKKINMRTGYTQSLFLLDSSIFKKILIYLIELLSYRFANFSTVTSEHQRRYISNRYNAKNMHIIPNGIDINLFKPLKNTTIQNKTKLLFIGRLHPEKNIINLVNAIQNIPNISLEIIGNSGILKNNILKLRKKYKLSISLSANIPNSSLPKIYSEADIYIQPSLYEGNPKTILEAMSCGLPVIASNIDGTKNIIKHKENGFLCETCSNSIKNAILTLKNNNKLRDIIGSKARKYIKKNYALDKCIEKEIKLYERYSQ
ncbi:MAG: glycosyltransferase family 4 protein [Candidatus Moranbacteria bacterium]|jgi:glycosyltransferase involved in cell wall biosynthesis|nr:glycosyltransferase family 4 protein [Candidatus Moranbacteria bacterium]